MNLGKERAKIAHQILYRRLFVGHMELDDENVFYRGIQMDMLR